MYYLIAISFCLLMTLTSSFLTGTEFDFLSDAFIQSINSAQSTWKASSKFKKSMSMKSLFRYTGTRRRGSHIQEPQLHFHEADNKTTIPRSFDARKVWPNCTSIREIQDQAACGSCWAVSSASAMNDRICIHSNGRIINQRLSSIYLVSCCKECGDGCDGGYILAPWKQWTDGGIVTGGTYNSSSGCQDYPFAPCGSSCTEEDTTPNCTKTCEAGHINFESQLNFGNSYYRIGSPQEQIQMEIMKNGPLVSSFEVFADFMHYESGVYVKINGTNSTNPYIGGHAVRILGWGVENNIPYWLIANSWGTSWGENGFFKFLRGHHQCGLEQDNIGGIPKF